MRTWINPKITARNVPGQTPQDASLYPKLVAFIADAGHVASPRWDQHPWHAELRSMAMQCHMPARAGRTIQKRILNMREGSRTTRKERSDIQIASRNRRSSTLHRVHITTSLHLQKVTRKPMRLVQLVILIQLCFAVPPGGPWFKITSSFSGCYHQVRPKMPIFMRKHPKVASTA